MSHPTQAASEVDRGSTTWYKSLAQRWCAVRNLKNIESLMLFGLFKRKKILPLDYRMKQQLVTKEYVAMFDDGTPLRRHSVPDDEVARGNLSYDQFISLPKILRSPED